MTPGAPVELSPFFYECSVTDSDEISPSALPCIPFPNPAHSHICFPVADARIRIYDFTGKELFLKQENHYPKHIRFCTDYLPSGIYFYRIEGENVMHHGTFLILP